jgi:hypothetical protein
VAIEFFCGAVTVGRVRQSLSPTNSLLGPVVCFTPLSSRVSTLQPPPWMASTTSIPAYLLSGVPVQQPPHLEGDASLATEILPGPPSLVSAQQSVLKRDPRKPSTAYSYLPSSDPGSTYSGIMHGTLIGHEHEASPSKRPKYVLPLL